LPANRKFATLVNRRASNAEDYGDGEGRRFAQFSERVLNISEENIKVECEIYASHSFPHNRGITELQ
jgi:hypothetical protein